MIKKYRVGDTVVIKKDLQMEDNTIVREMLQYAGTSQVIINVSGDDSDDPCYTFLEDDYFWDNSMIDHDATKELAGLPSSPRRLSSGKSDTSYTDLYLVIFYSTGATQYIRPFFGLDKAKQFVKDEYESRLEELQDEDFNGYDLVVDGDLSDNGEASISDGIGEYDEWRIVSVTELVKSDSIGTLYELKDF